MIFLLKHLSTTLVTVTQRVIWPGLIGNWSYPFLFIFSLFHTSRTRGRHSMNLLFVEDPRIFSGCCLPKIAPNRNSHKDTDGHSFQPYFESVFKVKWSSFSLLFSWLAIVLREVQKYGLGLAMSIVTEWVGLGLGSESTLF